MSDTLGGDDGGVAGEADEVDISLEWVPVKLGCWQHYDC